MSRHWIHISEQKLDVCVCIYIYTHTHALDSSIASMPCQKTEQIMQNSSNLGSYRVQFVLD